MNKDIIKNNNYNKISRNGILENDKYGIMKEFSFMSTTIQSRNKSFNVKGATVVHDMDELKEVLSQYDTDDIYIIGGESIYKALVPYCDEAIVTKLDYSYQADSYFPDLDKLPEWEMVEESEEETCFSIEYTFRKYINKEPQRFI